MYQYVNIEGTVIPTPEFCIPAHGHLLFVVPMFGPEQALGLRGFDSLAAGYSISPSLSYWATVVRASSRNSHT